MKVTTSEEATPSSYEMSTGMSQWLVENNLKCYIASKSNALSLKMKIRINLIIKIVKMI